MAIIFTDGNLPSAGITNPVYAATDKQNVFNIEREIQRQNRQSNYQCAASCSQNEAACNGTNDLTVAKNVGASSTGACAMNPSYENDDSDRYTTLKEFHAKLDDINKTGGDLDSSNNLA